MTLRCFPIALNERSFRALDRAAKRDKHDWAQIGKWLRKGVAQVWSISGISYVLTLANADNEIEVLLAGGERAKDCIKSWEACMLAHPAHAGMTLRVEGRKGWHKLLPHWERRDDVLYLKVPPHGQKED